MKLFNETGKVSFDKVRNKIAKLLRLQTSNNAGEACLLYTSDAADE